MPNLRRRSCVRIGHQPKANTLSYFNFSARHPQARTHKVCLLEEKESYVPNFIGGAIPQKDTRSREEYCMTMLTLFKPWRSGKDLRPDEETSWSNIFKSHLFTKREQAVMKFFHIRYERNDARDDFSVQRKQAERGGTNTMYMSNDHMDEIDTQGIVFDPANREDDLVNAEDWDQDSTAEILRKSRMATAENVMKLSGWMDRMDSTLNEQIPSLTRRLKPDQPPTDWKTLLDNLRKDILDARVAEASKKKDKPGDQIPENNVVNQVKMVNKQYFMTKKFVRNDSQAKELIDSTVKSFSLNEEQERAFHVVANHAVQSCGEHLKMYLGGMAGTGKSQVIKALSHFFC
ncbi:hypothetical protein C8Q80DRAFT_1106610 [Daedaleopsis nitida]|nr:hypothetical protein C8Q80DRAFT_1106610 [Daedaleopsis nitida]